MHLIQPFAIHRLLWRVLFLLFFKTIFTWICIYSFFPLVNHYLSLSIQQYFVYFVAHQNTIGTIHWCTFKPWKNNFKFCALMHQNLLYDYYILRLYVSSKLFQGFHSITHLCFCVMFTRVCASVHSFNRTPISGLFVNEWKHHFHSLCIVINSFLI